MSEGDHGDTSDGDERQTRQKNAIRTVFLQAERPLTIEDVLSQARHTIPRLGLATVYRTLRAFVERGWLVAVDVPGRPHLYERAGKRHHHHFVCSRCERVYELDGCRVDVRAALPDGFVADGHALTVTGLCPLCRQRG